jgi:hypothetical protein
LNGNVSGDKATVFTAMFDPATLDMEVLHATGSGNYACFQASTWQVFTATTNPACPSSVWIMLPPNPTHHFVWGPAGFRSCTGYSC